MFVGTGSKRVRQLFSAARAKAPCVIFIDEIDSVGSTRTNSSVHPHANQTINQLLAEMDGFQKNEGVIVLGATNRRETLDAALMRPGRFDVEVRIDKPDLKARIEMLDYYLDKVAKDKNVDVEYLAKQLTGLGGSSIENVVNQAALRAVVTNSTSVRMEHLEWALDRTLMGYGKSRLMDEECNRCTAYHEAGHVLVSYFTKDSHPLHKVTILPRASSLGHTAFVPETDGYSVSKSQLMAQMDVAFGGRLAEEMIFGQDKVTTGASSDFQVATSLATNMVKSYGMSDKIGQRVFAQETNDLSPNSQEVIDQEIKRLLQESYDRARAILKSHSNELKLIAEALMVHETLDVNQIKSLIENQKL
jgi:ATP-dependent metalloprotease